MNFFWNGSPWNCIVMGAWKQYFNTFVTDFVNVFDMETLLFF